ncbi:MAG: hypothetical protein Q9222_001682 [Ikaeria aurantiellina]
MALNAKDYINDLIPNSGAIQAINDDFRHVFQELHLWSFYETVKTNLGVSQALIVEKDSAILGLPQEHVHLLNADHRHVCKFKDNSENNYITLRNAFASTIDQIEKEWLASTRDEYYASMKALTEYLGQGDMPDNDLANLLDQRMDGTCQWFTDDTDYNSWRTGAKDASKVLWLTGQPATGKSTIAAYVVKQLYDCNMDCGYFFFRHGDRSKSSVATMLRSFAYQMALTNPRIRSEILSMHDNGVAIDADDERTIWRSIFLTRIFRTDFHQPYFWIIDALDECTNLNCLLPMLARIDKSIPLRILVTSRPSSVIQTLILQERLHVLYKTLTVESSYQDIRCVLEANARFLPIDDPTACEALIARILDKANGCFLWATLVLKELEITHSEQQIQEVLDSVPGEMDSLYTRILDTMATVPRNQKLAQAILRWTVCAVRPLTVEELKEAIRLDLGEIIPRLERTVESVCGHLIHVDGSSRVQLVHQTVRAYLIQNDLTSDFAVNRVREHSRLAEVCLQYLCSDEMKSSRFRRRGSATRTAKKSVFADYAAIYFSEHIVRSSSSSDEQMARLHKFMDTNILSWIEIVALAGDLYFLTQTAKNLKAYMERRAKYRSPLGQEVHTVSSWVSDLIHLVTTFGRSLLISPSSIHFLVPPVCPRNSIIYQQYHEYPRCLEVVGQAELEWDDRLSCITFSECQVLAVACRDARFAIGLSDGRIILYHTSTCQEAGNLLHGTDAVRFLELGSANTFLASGGRRNVVLWDVIAGTKLWEASITQRLLGLGFNESDTLLIGTTVANCTKFWNVDNGHELETLLVSDQVEDESDGYQRPPSHAEICGELNLLAVGYRQRPINLWDLEDKSFIGQFHKSAPDVYPGPLLVAMVFNPNPDMNLAAASYQDGDLVVFDPWNQRQHAISEANAHVLAASPDGATLATGDSNGTIQVFDFETLRLLYRSCASDLDVRAIVFASNNVRFFDIRRDHCNVWEPSAIIRQTDSGDGSSEYCSEGIMPDVETSEARPWGDDETMTAMVSDGSDLLFCGKENGSVVVYDTKNGQQLQELYTHTTQTAIIILTWNLEGNILVSADRSSRFQVRKLSRLASGLWIAEEPLINQSIGQALRQALISSDGKMILLSAISSDQIWGLDGKQLATRTVAGRQSWRWINLPSSPPKLLLVTDGEVQHFDWQTLKCDHLPSTLNTTLGDRNHPPIANLVMSSKSSLVCAFFREPPGRQSRARLRLWTFLMKDEQDQGVKDLAEFDSIASNIKTVIGFHKDIGKGSIVLVRRDGIAVFHRGLEFEERFVMQKGGHVRNSEPKTYWSSPTLENHIDSPRAAYHQWERE